MISAFQIIFLSEARSYRFRNLRGLRGYLDGMNGRKVPVNLAPKSVRRLSHGLQGSQTSLSQINAKLVKFSTIITAGIKMPERRKWLGHIGQIIMNKINRLAGFAALVRTDNPEVIW